MTVEEAIAAMRERWAHAPVDVRDVEERVAVRELGDVVMVAGPSAHCPAARVFVQRGDGWRSCYVHRPADVDAALDRCRRAA